MSLFEEVMRLSDEEAYEFVRDAVFSGGFRCPRCGQSEAFFISTRHVYRCKHCGAWFSVKSVSIFRKSHLTLKQWLLILAAFVEEEAPTARKLSRRLGVAYNTAYLALQKVRAVMRSVVQENCASFQDVVGMFFLLPGISRRQRQNKNPRQILACEENARLHIHLTEKGEQAFQGKRLSSSREKKFNWLHEAVRGAKRLLGEVYRRGCWKHTQRYLDEFCFRWNEEKKEHFWMLLGRLCGEHLPWKKLKSEPLILLEV